jgi:hypothetical protein
LFQAKAGNPMKNKLKVAGHQWLILIVLVTWEAEIGRIVV